jgi:hypothetical protein
MGKNEMVTFFALMICLETYDFLLGSHMPVVFTLQKGPAASLKRADPLYINNLRSELQDFF